ncbi:MAG: hypothetical protein RJA44_2348 [Pseudomonadota bacterium]
MLTPVSRQRGMTIVELMVTLTLLGLLMIAALPSIGTWLRNNEIRTVAEALLAGLQKARSEAVRRNDIVLFSMVSANATSKLLDASCALSSGSGAWVVSLDSPAGLCDKANSETTTPRIIDRYATNEGGRNAVVSVLAVDATNGNCGAMVARSQIAFDGYGRLDTKTIAQPIRCIEVSHPDDGSVRLRLVIGTGGTLRLCDPTLAATSTDPRRCVL